jgi:hypothetical protein
VELLPEAYQAKLFQFVRSKQLDKSVEAQALKDLERFGLAATGAGGSSVNDKESPPPIPDITAQMPELAGRNVLEHFQTVGEAVVRPYRDLLDGLLLAPHIPPPPADWSLQPGWVRSYHQQTCTCLILWALVYMVVVMFQVSAQWWRDNLRQFPFG